MGNILTKSAKYTPFYISQLFSPNFGELVPEFGLNFNHLFPNLDEHLMLVDAHFTEAQT